MKRAILSVDVVSDGIIVEFESGLRCYYSADFLVANANTGSNCTFLDYDPTPHAAKNEIGFDPALRELAAQILPFRS